jgi:hypothetical protein
MPKMAKKAAKRDTKKGGSFDKGNDSDDENESHKQVNVDLPFMATIARLGNFIEQGKPLIDRTTPSTNSEEKTDVHKLLEELLQTRSNQLASRVADVRRDRFVDEHEKTSAHRLHKGGVHVSGSASVDDESTISFTEKGVGLLAWMQDRPLQIAMHRHGSVSLPSSPMLAIKPGSPLKFAARSGMRSGTPGLRVGGVESMPGSPYLALGPMKGGSPLRVLSAASTRVNADSGHLPRACEVDSYADSPNVKTSVLKSKNSLVDKIRGLVNPKALNARSGGAQSFEGSPLPSNSTSATGIVGIFVCVWVGKSVLLFHLMFIL